MMDSRGVAAVTLALRDLLAKEVLQRDPGLGGLEVTVHPPDQARRGLTGPQLNLFLYQLSPNPAWRGFDPRAGAGEPGPPPLALDLRYLLTAWGRGDGDAAAISHRALAAALAVLQDKGTLEEAELRKNFESEATPLPAQPERVKLAPMPLGIEDLSKLWTAFQAGYRPSAACEATVVLIETRRPRRVAPPVLRRGEGDTGPQAIPGPAPVLRALHPPDRRPSAEPGEAVRVEGSGLAAALELALAPLAGGPELALPLSLSPDGAWEATLDAAAAWRPGKWSARLRRPLGQGRHWVSAAQGLAVAPRIRTLQHAMAGPELEVTVQATPPLGEDQPAELALGAAGTARMTQRSSVTLPGGEAATRLAFRMAAPEPGTHAVRLRVEEVESRGERRQDGTGPWERDPGLEINLP